MPPRTLSLETVRANGYPDFTRPPPLREFPASRRDYAHQLLLSHIDRSLFHAAANVADAVLSGRLLTAETTRGSAEAWGTSLWAYRRIPWVFIEALHDHDLSPTELVYDHNTLRIAAGRAVLRRVRFYWGIDIDHPERWAYHPGYAARIFSTSSPTLWASPGFASDEPRPPHRPDAAVPIAVPPASPFGLATNTPTTATVFADYRNVLRSPTVNPSPIAPWDDPHDDDPR